jgi:hypothetical protein
LSPAPCGHCLITTIARQWQTKVSVRYLFIFIWTYLTGSAKRPWNHKSPRLSVSEATPSRQSTSNADWSAPPPKRFRAIDAFLQLPESSVFPPHPPASQLTAELPLNSRAIDLFNLFPPAPEPHVPRPSPSVPSNPVSSKPIRAIDLLSLFPVNSSSTASASRPIAPLPRRVHVHLPSKPADIDLTLPTSEKSCEVLELTDSDEEMDKRPALSQKPTRPQRHAPNGTEFVFNTNDLLSTRQTIRSWKGSYLPEHFILSREELHADQVDQDRALPEEMNEASFPSFVSGPFPSYICLKLPRPYPLATWNPCIGTCCRVTRWKISKIIRSSLPCTAIPELLRPKKPVRVMLSLRKSQDRLKPHASQSSRGYVNADLLPEARPFLVLRISTSADLTFL